jgi:hypothetical protein
MRCWRVLPTLRLLSSLLLTAGGAAALRPLVASAAAVPPPCSSSVVSTTADGQLPCSPQPGQVLIVVTTVAGGTDQTTANATTTSSGAAASINASSDGMPTLTDPRVDTYEKRQAIRDQYRGQIDETTFNDELADGDGLDKALQDALTAFKQRATRLGHG